jgi:hypothetical protein
MLSQRFTHQVPGPVAGLRLLAAAGIAAWLVAVGCGKVTSSPVAPAVVDTGVASLSIEPAGSSVAPGGELAIIVQATGTNGGPAKDGTVVTLTNDALGAIIPATIPTLDGNARATFRAGTTKGTSTIRAQAGNATDTVSIKIAADAPPPAPPAPPAPPPEVADDDIPIADVIWHHASPSNFKVTAQLSNVHINGLTISWTWSQPGWKAEDGNSGGVVGNMWVFAKIKGQWHAATFEWLRRTTSRSHLEAVGSQPPFVQAEDGTLSNWRPTHGEQIGFMASTMCRSGIPPRSVRQRSPIRLTTWP